jgi:hypothetical protein
MINNISSLSSPTSGGSSPSGVDSSDTQLPFTLPVFDPTPFFQAKASPTQLPSRLQAFDPTPLFQANASPELDQFSIQQSHYLPPATEKGVVLLDNGTEEIQRQLRSLSADSKMAKRFAQIEKLFKTATAPTLQYMNIGQSLACGEHINSQIMSKIKETEEKRAQGILEILRRFKEDQGPEVNAIKASKYEALLRTSLQFIDKEIDNLLEDLKSCSPADLRLLELVVAIYQSNLLRSQSTRGELSHLEDVRQKYTIDLLCNLEQVATLAENSNLIIQPRLRSFIFGLCHALYTQNDMKGENEALLKMFTEGRKKSGDLLTDLAHVREKINKAPDEWKTWKLNLISKSLKDHFDLGFDPLKAGNPPQRLNGVHFGDNHVLNIIGMGSPTIQPTLGGRAVINPIFRGYLHALVERGEIHIYVSNQKATGEKDRNDPIMELQDEPAFSDCFYAITCSKNSHFYEGHGPDDLASFKAELHKQFFEYDRYKSGCYIPEKLKTELRLSEKSQAIIDIIGKELLGITDEKATLTPQQKKFYIDTYYSLLILSIVLAKKVDNINFTCKDGIDRGMESLAEFLMMLIFVLGLEEEAFDTLNETLNTRAWWVRKRAIIEERINRFLSDAGVLLDPDKKEHLRAAYRDIFDLIFKQFGFTNFTVESLPLPRTSPAEAAAATRAATAAAAAAAAAAFGPSTIAAATAPASTI